MKKTLSLLGFTLLSTLAYSQLKNTLSLAYGINYNVVNIHGVKGDFGYNLGGGLNYGISYSCGLNHLFSIESGLLFSDNKIQGASATPGANPVSNGDIKMVSVPFLAKVAFSKYLYADGGLTADLETNYSINSVANNQSGIGFEVGFGCKYNIGHVNIFLNPFWTSHGLIFFDSKSSYNLIEAGIKFGLGYNF